MKTLSRFLHGFNVALAGALALLPIGAQATSDADWVNVGDVRWMPAGNGVVYATVADSFGSLYVGGGFNRAGGINATNVAKWNGTTWSPLGLGIGSISETIRAMAVSGSNLYVGGTFTTAGGIAATNVAKWDGSDWSPLGSGVNGTVTAMALSGSDLYVGGIFTMAGGIAAANVAKWDGSNWSALGTGLNDWLYALVVSGGELYAGGNFTMAGGSNANRVARWNGSAWSALGTGLNSSVFALAASGSNLYVGGAFTTAGGSNANRVARWDGTAWSTLGLGVNFGFQGTYIYTLTVSGNDLYVGGDFQKAGEGGALRVAKWNGNAWSPLGSGVGLQNYVDYVFAIALSGSDLYVGGKFSTAGGKSVRNIARVIGPSVFTSIVPDSSATQAVLNFDSSPGAVLNLLSSTNLADWQTNTTVTATNVTNSVSVNLTQPQEFFRLQRLP